MKKIFIGSLLVVSIILTGCITKSPHNLTPIPAFPMEQQGKLPFTFKIAPPTFTDTFDNGYNTPWSFYQGSHQFANGVLKMSVLQNAGAYAYIKSNWTNVSVQADIKLSPNSWGAAIGTRYNFTNGASYQTWLYYSNSTTLSSQLVIEKRTNWYNGVSRLATISIPDPGTNWHTIAMVISNNVIASFLDGTPLLTCIDTNTPFTKGGICLSLLGGTTGTTATYDNVLVYNVNTVVPTPVQLQAITPPLTVLQGSDVILSATATGNPITYQWNGTANATNNTFNITNVQPNNMGVYTLTVSSLAGLGNVITNTSLIVLSTNILPYDPSTGSVTIAWCPSDSTNVAGYRMYYGSGITVNWTPNVYVDTNCPPSLISSGANWLRSYTNAVDAGTNLSISINSLLINNTYYFAATTYDNTALESDFSEEIQYTLLPSPPKNTPLFTYVLPDNNVELIAKTYPSYLASILCSSNFVDWDVLVTTNADIYGNLVYIDAAKAPMRFYRLMY